MNSVIITRQKRGPQIGCGGMAPQKRENNTKKKRKKTLKIKKVF
jgi:hypothetical protein